MVGPLVTDHDDIARPAGDVRFIPSDGNRAERSRSDNGPGLDVRVNDSGSGRIKRSYCPWRP